jgi:hypothetical protein
LKPHQTKQQQQQQQQQQQSTTTKMAGLRADLKPFLAETNTPKDFSYLASAFEDTASTASTTSTDSTISHPGINSSRPLSTYSNESFETFTHLHESRYARMIRHIDGEADYLDELERVARVMDGRKAAAMRRFQRRAHVLEKNRDDKNQLRRIKRRVVLFLKECYEIEG